MQVEIPLERFVILDSNGDLPIEFMYDELTTALVDCEEFNQDFPGRFSVAKLVAVTI
jgi:hypothetical protein